MELLAEMKRESGMSALDLTRSLDWKLNPNVNCRVTLDKIILPSETEFDSNLEGNGGGSRTAGSLERNDNNIDVDTDTHCYRNLKLLIHKALGIFQKCEEKCGVCDKYIHKLFNHLIDSHGEKPTDSDNQFLYKNLNFTTQNFLSDPGLNTIPSYENEIYSEDVKPVISPINPPEHVNYFNVINKNLKQEPDDVECQEDPLLNLEQDITEKTGDTDMHNGQKQSHRKFKCLLCPKSFTTDAHLSRHNLTHTGERPYKCETCGWRFALKYQLTTHNRIHTLEKKSGKIKTFSCLLCPKSFPSKDSLFRHNFTHTEERPYRCEVCEKRFRSLASFKYHKVSHTGKPRERHHKCDVCEKSFTRPRELNYHMVLHTGQPREKPYECDVCAKSFALPGILKGHKKIHTNERPHECQTCGKGFVSLTHLRLHLVTHTGVKAFKCELCGKSFGSTNTLRVHKKTIHTRNKKANLLSK